MPIFYRGAGRGTHWHKNDPRISGFIAHSPAISHSVERVMRHLVYGTTASPYISLTRSYGVAESYAMRGSPRPSKVTPGFVWEIDIPPELVDSVSTLKLIDPVKEIAKELPLPSGSVSYQHDGSPAFLVGVLSKKSRRHLNAPRPMPPGSNPPFTPPTLTLELRALVFALRDAEVLAHGVIPRDCVICSHEVY